MATFFQKLQTAAQNPVLFRTYLHWWLTKLITHHPPALRISNRTRISNWISFSEFWSFHEGIPCGERRFIQRWLARGSKAVAFDVGANIGIFSCFLASHPSTEVHAFEPVPITFRRLEANVTANGLSERCKLNCLALGRKSEQVTFALQGCSPATNRLYVGGAKSTFSHASLEKVAAVRLDDYCGRNGVQYIDFLKIDVEGMEP